MEPPPSPQAVCGACLSTGRALAPLSAQRELRRLYYGLLPTHTQTASGEEPIEVLMCWECRVALWKTMRFQMRANRARDLLEKARGLQDTDFICDSLSTLQYSHRTTYDVIIIDGVTSMKKEILSDDDYLTDAPECVSDFEDSKPIVELVEAETKLIQLEAMKNENANMTKPKIEKEPKPYKKIGRISNKSLSKKKLCELPYRMIKISGKRMLRLREEARRRPKYLNAPFKCESCIMPFQFVTAYETHLKLRHSDVASNYLCNICNGKFKNSRVLKIHKRSHYRHYHCNDCDVTLLSGTAMYQHYIVKHLTRTSTSSRYYKCLECGVRFDRKKLLTLHKKSLHEYYECDKCGRRFSTRNSIERHLPSHQTDCKLCGLVLANRSILRNHNFFVHQTHDVSKSEAYCVECDKRFKHRIAYREHVNRVHRSVKIKYPCTQCEKDFSKKCYLRNHIDLVHLNANRFQCHICSKNFLRRDGMLTHIKSVHEGVTLPRNKMCDICGRGFQTKKILVNHRRTHTGERPYECDLCSAAFTQVTPLKTHLKRIHQQERSGRELSIRVHKAATERDAN